MNNYLVLFVANERWVVSSGNTEYGCNFVLVIRIVGSRVETFEEFILYKWI